MLSKNYLWINTAVLFLTFALIACQAQMEYKKLPIDMDLFWGGEHIVLFCTVVLVQVVKGCRLYFELYEKRMPKGLFIRQYCKVVPVSMILPGKLGDFFRAYCYGYHLGDYIAGMSVIVLDRFVDTLGLLTVMLALFTMYNSLPQKLCIFLFFFLLMLLAIYTTFPGMRRYWCHYLLVQPASDKNLNRLRLVKRMQKAYSELQRIVHGKFLIIYLLSLLAWSIEIGSLAVCCKYLTGESVHHVTEAYLSSAISGDPSRHLLEFIGVSVLVLLFMYLIAAVWYYGRKKEWHG